MRAIGFTQGQLGDLIISTVAARSFKENVQNSTLTLGINKKYSETAPLFANHPHFDNIHFYDGYDNWPTEIDINYLKSENYDIIFPAMPKRGTNESSWWKTEHQCQNICSLYGLPHPRDGYQCHLTKWFDIPDYSNYIAFNYIGAFYAGYPNNKSYSPEQAQQIVNLIRKIGYKVIILGDPKEPRLENAEKKNLSYFESVKTMLGCKALIGVDSGLTWVASAYSHPVLASYSNEYYGKEFISSIQPINPNARYLDEKLISQISVDKIEQELSIILS